MFLLDTFTDTANVLLENHAPNTGGTWVPHPSFAGSSAKISTVGTVKSNNAINNVYYNAADPGTADYYVQADVVINTNLSCAPGVVARIQSGALSWADLIYDQAGGAWHLRTAIAGSFENNLSSSVSYSNGTTVTARIECKGTTIYGYVNGVLLLTITGTALTAKGFAGLITGAVVTGDATGINLDNLSASQVQTVAVTDSHLFFSPSNWYSDGGGALQANNVKGSSTYAVTNNTGAFVKFNATTVANGYVALDLDTSIFAGINAARCPQICYSVDGGAFTTALLVQASGTTRVFLSPLATAGTHTYSMYFQGVVLDGSGNMDGDRWTNLTTDAIAVKVTGVELDGQSAIASPMLLPYRMLVFSDSNGEGAQVGNGTNIISNRDATQAFPYLLAQAFNAELGNISFGGQGYEIAGPNNVPTFPLAYNLYSAGHARSWTNQPDYIVIQQGRNGTTVAADVSTMLTNIRAVSPSAVILQCQTPDQTGASAITQGVTNYKAANTSDTKVYLVDPARSFISGLTSNDSLHLNGLRGHPAYASALAAIAEQDIDLATYLGAIYTRVTTALPNAAAGAANGLMRLGANVGNTTFTGASLSQPALSIDGLQMINANWGSYPLYFNDTLGTGTVGLSAVGAASVFTLTSAGGHIFNMTPGTNKDVFHATLSGTGLMFNPAANVIVSPGSGGDLVTVSITDQTSGDPVAGARVWLTSDAAGHTVVAGTLTTDASGHATFLLTAGSTYYLWMTATGQNSIEGTPFVAVRD
jgi:hypothetical protein